MKYRLTDNHEAMIAFNKLCEYADELGISVSFWGIRTVVRYNGKTYDLEDNENFDHVTEFPPDLEFKMTYEKEEKD